MYSCANQAEVWPLLCRLTITVLFLILVCKQSYETVKVSCRVLVKKSRYLRALSHLIVRTKVRTKVRILLHCIHLVRVVLVSHCKWNNGLYKTDASSRGFFLFWLRCVDRPASDVSVYFLFTENEPSEPPFPLLLLLLVYLYQQHELHEQYLRVCGIRKMSLLIMRKLYRCREERRRRKRLAILRVMAMSIPERR